MNRHHPEVWVMAIETAAPENVRGTGERPRHRDLDHHFEATVAENQTAFLFGYTSGSGYDACNGS